MGLVDKVDRYYRMLYGNYYFTLNGEPITREITLKELPLVEVHYKTTNGGIVTENALERYDSDYIGRLRATMYKIMTPMFKVVAFLVWITLLFALCI